MMLSKFEPKRGSFIDDLAAVLLHGLTSPSTPLT
jgi:hypothetical protein